MCEPTSHRECPRRDSLQLDPDAKLIHSVLMSALLKLDWKAVRDQYDLRGRVHRQLLALHRQRKVSDFVDLLLGISDPAGNYSAAEHGLGPKVLTENLNAEDRLWAVAEEFLALRNPHDVPPTIRRTGLRYFQIGVGSEASCMMNPQVCWVANVRTIWTHLVIKHADSFRKADEELELYRESDVTSEMAYQMWQAIHGELAGTITRIAEEGTRLSTAAGVTPGPIKYLWADAIANQLYADHHE